MAGGTPQQHTQAHAHRTKPIVGALAPVSAMPGASSTVSTAVSIASDTDEPVPNGPQGSTNPNTVVPQPVPSLPGTGFLRLWHIIGDATASPPIPALIPVSKSTWWDGIKSGRFPKPVKLGPRTTAWRIQDIRALIESYGK